MNMKIKPISQITLGILLATGLVACGGGSGSSNTTNGTGTGTETGTGTGTGTGTETGTGAGTGNCVSFPRPAVGQKTKTLIKTLTAPATETTIELTVTAFSATSMSTSKSTTGAVTATGTATNTFTIANNYIDTTEITSQDTTTISVPIVGDITTITDITSTFSPFTRAAIDEVCENQTWTDTYDLVTATNITTLGSTTPASSTASQSVIHTIESINETVTVDAGTFATFKEKREDGSIIVQTWTDIATGINVKVELKDASGTLVSTQELVQ